MSAVPVDDIERVQQQLAAFVSSGQLPEMSLAEIPELGFAIDDSTFAGDALQALSTVTEDLDAAEPQMAHLGPSLSSLVGGGGGGFGGGGGAGGAGVAGRDTGEAISGGRDGDDGRGQSIHERGERGENGGGRADNSGGSSGSSNSNGGSASSGNGSANNGSASNGSTGRTGGTTDAPRGVGPGGPSDAGRIGGGSNGNGTYQVPEPSSMLLIGLGLAGAVVTRRRQRAR
jgi:hypothetical protein